MNDKSSQMLEAGVVSRSADVVERTKAAEQQAGVLTDQTALLDLAQSTTTSRIASRQKPIFDC